MTKRALIAVGFATAIAIASLGTAPISGQGASAIPLVITAYNGTAPVEVSSGGRKVYRLSLRGNRRLNHAIHMAAITQIRHKHSNGRGYYQRKIAEGKTHKEALRCLKRRISDAIFACLQADARRAAAAAAKSPGGQPGNHSVSRAAGSHPAHRLFGQVLISPRGDVAQARKSGRVARRRRCVFGA